MIAARFLILFGLWCTVQFNACSPVPERRLIESRCNSQLMDHEKITCYQDAIVKQINQRLAIGTRHLSTSDWPFNYAARIDVALNANGDILSVKLLQPTSSRQLNKKLVQSITRIGNFIVPHDKLFFEAGFSRLRFLIKPGRNPILGTEKKLPEDIIIIYLPGPCATRSQQC